MRISKSDGMKAIIEKGGLRNEHIFPAPSPAWPRQRPANAFAGSDQGPFLLKNRLLVCPSWHCSVDPVGFVVCIFQSAARDASHRRWPESPRWMTVRQDQRPIHDPHQHPQSRHRAGQSALFETQSRRQCRRPYRPCRRQTAVESRRSFAAFRVRWRQPKARSRRLAA